jgi:UDP-2,4-diacetamido-2,4,6-trideoxy-beta-L-altropyranose hydrolase
MVAADPSEAGAGGPLLVLRADAGPAIGAGHVVRCSALGEAWVHAGGRAVVLGRSLPVAPLVAGLEHRDVSGPGGAALAADAADLGAAAIVVDTYDFGPADLAAVVGVAPTLHVVDGPWAGPFGVALLNQNLAASSADYAAPASTELLLGAPYVLLRGAIALRTPRVRSVDVGEVVVTFGASDPLRLGPPVAAAVAAALPAAHVTLLVGPLAGPATSSGAFEVVVDPGDVGAVLDAADLVVTAAGSTCWEAARLGVPMVAVVIADNQVAVAEGIVAHDLGEVVSTPDLEVVTATTCALAADGPRRADLAVRGPLVIDGRGAERVVATLSDAAR